MRRAPGSFQTHLTCPFWNPFSLQLQHQDTGRDAATYGSLRPYRESPLLARARRTESFHSYRDFQTLNLSRDGDPAVPENANSGPGRAEVKCAAGEGAVPERKSPGAETKGGRESESGVEAHKIAEAFLEPKKRSSEEENDSRVELRRKGGFEGGGFLGRKKVVPHLASSPSTSDGGTDSPGTASPSPTKTTPSPRHKKSDSSGQEYSL